MNDTANIVKLLIVVLVMLLFPLPLRAEFDTTHFRFHPDAGSVGLAQNLSKIAEDKRKYVLGRLGTVDERVIDVKIASDEDEMARLLGAERHVQEWIAGVAISRRNMIVMSARGNEIFQSMDTFVHELAHVYLDAAVVGRHVPRWFHEGFAMLVASQEVGERLKTMMSAAVTGSFIPLQEIDQGFPARPPAVHLAYAQSMLFIRFLERQKAGSGISELIGRLRDGLPFELAFSTTFGGTPDDLFERFLDDFDSTSAVVAFLTSATVLWLAIVMLFLYVQRKKRQKAALKKLKWEYEDQLIQSQMNAEVEAEMEARLAQVLGGRPADGPVIEGEDRPESELASDSTIEYSDGVSGEHPRPFMGPGPREIQ